MVSGCYAGVGAETPCKQRPGAFEPVVELNRCEAKGPCIEVCPVDVFVLGPIGPAEKSALSIVGRIKSWAHGGMRADPVHADRCEACGLCVTACPEHAITLRRRVAPTG